MNLITSVYLPNGNLNAKSSQIPICERWFHETTTKCAVSGKNLLLFVSLSPLVPACALNDSSEDEQNPLQFKKDNAQKVYCMETKTPVSGKYFVYVCDLNTPWDVHLITACSHQVTVLEWDNDNGCSFVMADSKG